MNVQSKPAHTLLYSCGSQRRSEALCTELLNSLAATQRTDPVSKTSLMLSRYSALLLLQPPTLVAEDIGKLTDFVQQLAVGDFHRIPRLVPFPGKKKNQQGGVCYCTGTTT